MPRPRQAIACAITSSSFTRTVPPVVKTALHKLSFHVTCRSLITSLNSFTKVYKSIFHINLEIIIEYNYIDLVNYLNVIYNETLLY